MSRKKTKRGKVICLAMVLTLLCTSDVQAKNENNVDKEYIENHSQISLDGLELTYDRETREIEVEVSDDIKWYKKDKAKKAEEKVEFLLSRYDQSLDELLIETLEGGEGEIIGISYTECPLEMNSEGQLVRVENDSETDSVSLIKKAGAVGKTGGAGKKHYFSLVTSVTRSDTKDAYGRYLYTCRTSGVWSKNSVLSGSKYPASGNDYVLQSVPNTFSRTSDYLTVGYNTGLAARNGKHYSLENGAAKYVKYSIVDDPLGTAQLAYFNLKTCYRAKEGTGRTINSYYVHTWKAMTLSATVTASTDKSVSLSITPSIADKSWQVYSYVTFDF